MNEKHSAYVHKSTHMLSAITFSLKEEGNLTLTTIWMNLEGITTNEISQTQKTKNDDPTCMYNLKESNS
jgi:hypothetical protein